MKQKKLQLAHIYRDQILMDYGVAVDGVLLSQQLSTTVNTELASIPSITAVFRLDACMNDNPVRINPSENDA